MSVALSRKTDVKSDSTSNEAKQYSSSNHFFSISLIFSLVKNL